MRMHTIKKLSDSRIEIKLSIQADVLLWYFTAALAELKKEVELPGFRKGMVPEKTIVEKMGEMHIWEDAAERALREAWPRIIEEEHLEPIGRPEISITKLAKGNPLECTMTVSVLGEIQLPEYKKIAEEIFGAPAEIVVTDEEVQKALEFVKKEAKPEHQHETDEVKLTDMIRKNLTWEKEHQVKGEKRMKTLGAIEQKTKLELPSVVVDAELEKMTAELKASVIEMGLTWDQYLLHIKKSEEDVRKEWRTEAEKRAKYGLIIREIAKREHLSPSEEILEKQADDILKRLTEDERKKASKENLKDYLFGKLRNEMVFDFLAKKQ